VLNGGKLNQVLRRAKVFGVPAKMPDYIDIDISKLKIGGAVKVKDLKLADVTFKENPNQILVSVKAKRGAKIGDDADEEEVVEEAPAAEAAE
jgi:large subunit ribosomal protein L25